MTKEIILTGTVPNDGTGDTIRESFIKTNHNFTELYGRTAGPTGPTGPTSTVPGPTGPTGAASTVPGPTGPTGPAGPGALWNFTSAYNGGASYAVGDLATYGGETWYRIHANGGNTGDTPVEGTFWTMIASSGAVDPTLSGSTSAYATKRVLQYNEVTGAITYSNTLDAVSPYITGYGAEIHVSPVAFDNSGNGTIGDPVKTIAQAQVLAALAFETTGVGERKTIVLHPGNYAENVTINTQFTFLTTRESIGKNATLSGTLTISKGCTIHGLKITNLVIDATSAFGTVDIVGCAISTATTKTSTAYANFRACDLSVSSLSITGGGIVALVGGNYGTVTVNNASASVLAKAVVTMGPVTLTAGTLQLAETVVYSATDTSNAITQSAGSVVTLYNSQTLIPALTSVARNSFGGYYSIINSVYDKTNTTFGGISLSSVSYNQLVNADRLTLNGSTSGSTILNATAVAGTTTLTLPSATDTLVGRTTTDTLTNKTLSSAVLSGTLTAGGGVGTSGYVLTSTGSGVNWSDISYTASTPANWTGTAPSTMQAAVDRLAVVVKALNGGVGA